MPSVKTRTVWVAYTNTDNTEGRGADVPIAVCDRESTARRLARKAYVQGSDGPVRSLELIQIDGQWYAPGDAIRILPATAEDLAAEKLLENLRLAWDKARAAGLTEDDIRLLANGGLACSAP